MAAVHRAIPGEQHGRHLPGHLRPQDRATSARGKPFKQNTIADHIIILKRFYGWAIENGYTDLPDRKIRRLKIPTKDTLTKEAAALETVAAMGWEQFTIKMLQEAIGLSYQQTYRILNGYASRRATHPALLEKCPAVSYFDTMVAEDGEGYAVRRREHLFSFDEAVYRRWAFGGGDRDDGGRKGCGRAGVRVWSVGDREFVLGGVWGGERECVRGGDVRVLLGDGGGGGMIKQGDRAQKNYRRSETLPVSVEWGERTGKRSWMLFCRIEVMRVRSEIPGVQFVPRPLSAAVMMSP